MNTRTPLVFGETLVELIRARHPILLVETHEGNRVIAAAEAVATSPDLRRSRRVVTYTVSKGLHAPGQAGKPTAPDAALAEAIKAPEPTIFVFFDLHHFLGAQGRPAEPTMVRAVQDAATAFRTGDVPHTLIIVSPGLTLPADLEKEVTVVDLPLPTAGEIEGVLDEIVTANAASIVVDLSPDDHQRLIQAAQGLTLGEAENAFARAIASDRRLDASDIALVLDEKRQTIRKSGLLENETLQKQAQNNSRSHFGSSPHLEKAVTDAVSNSMDSHYNLSLQALGDKAKMQALLRMLSELVYEELRT